MKAHVYATSLVAVLAVSPAAADTAGVDLPSGQYYAIDACPQVRGGCASTTIGADDQGSISLRVASGEFIAGYIDEQLITYSENPGPSPLDAATSVWGKLTVYGSIASMVARRVSADADLEQNDATILVDATSAASAVVILLPISGDHPGRRATIKKVAGSRDVIVRAPSGDSIDGAADVVLSAQWQFATVEATPIGDYVAGFTANAWSVVGR